MMTDDQGLSSQDNIAPFHDRESLFVLHHQVGLSDAALSSIAPQRLFLIVALTDHGAVFLMIASAVP
jgi:hypothetical protein